ncbi:MAG: hypothetical protein ABL900_10365 [Burkholderiaceae bacterium]
MDAYAPKEIARRVNEFCVVKARLPLLTLSLLGVLAGAFIGLGALMFALIASDTSLGFAATRLLGRQTRGPADRRVTGVGWVLRRVNNRADSGARRGEAGSLFLGELLRQHLRRDLAPSARAAGSASPAGRLSRAQTEPDRRCRARR